MPTSLKGRSSKKKRKGAQQVSCISRQQPPLPSQQQSPDQDSSDGPEPEDGNAKKSRLKPVSQLVSMSNDALEQVVCEQSMEDKSDEPGPRPKTGISLAAKQLDIPQTFFEVVDVAYKLTEKDKDPEVQLSNSMVVRYIAPKSCLLPFLLVGDQILEVNGRSILTVEEFTAAVLDQLSGRLRVVRPWNNTHCGERLPARRNKESSYLVVDFHKFPGMSNGFEIVYANMRCEVTKIKPQQRGQHAFYKKDRLIDVDSSPIIHMASLQDVRRKFNETLAARKRCSFLVERPLTLQSSPNTSLTAARTATPPLIEMGDDACEIGAREATRFKTMADSYRIKPILKGYTANSATTKTRSEEELPPAPVGEQRKGGKPKKKKKAVSIEGRMNKISKVPTDVKDGTVLQKVTAKSGLIGFVRSYLSR